MTHSAVRCPGRVAEVAAFCDPFFGSRSSSFLSLILQLCALAALVVTGSQGVALKYKRVYLIFTTKMPGVAEVADFYDSYYCNVPW